MKVVSGGQTGADRAALDFALSHGVPHGGWCPNGRKAEDGAIGLCYRLTETPSADYAERTEWNVRDADATVVFSITAALTGGSKTTFELARRQGKPVIHLSRDGGPESPERVLLGFIQEHRVRILNVAGPRASMEPEVAAFVRTVLGATWELAKQGSLLRGTTLESTRLILRPLALADAPALARLAGRREIADTTISIPHPYSEEQARDWIAARAGPQAAGNCVVFAITLREEGRLVGTIGLREIDREHSQAELGFWVGVDSWGQGYATEAAQAVVDFAFRGLELNRVYANHLVRNPASERVLEKIGMRAEGLLRQRVRKWGVFEDVGIRALVRSDWESLLRDSKPRTLSDRQAADS